MIIDLTLNELIKENEFIKISSFFINENNINENNIIKIIENEIKYNNYNFYRFKKIENEIRIFIYENENYNKNYETLLNEILNKKLFNIVLYENDKRLKEIKEILKKYELKEKIL